MVRRTRYTISLLPDDIDIVEHLDKIKKQTTISMYVRNLIKKDIDKADFQAFDMDKLIEVVIERIKNDGELQLSGSQGHEEITITEEQRDIISSLF